MPTMQRAAILVSTGVLLLLATCVVQSEEVPPPSAATPPRLSLVDGQVSFLRTGAQDCAGAHQHCAGRWRFDLYGRSQQC